jgi:hypothetical protein
MSPVFRGNNGFILLEALGAICVLTVALGSLTLLLTVASNVKRQSLTQVHMRYLLSTHLEALRAEIGDDPDCSMLLDEVREDRSTARTFRYSRTIGSPAWDGAAPAPNLLQLTIAVVPEGGTEVRHDSVAALFPCIQPAH